MNMDKNVNKLDNLSTSDLALINQSLQEYYERYHINDKQINKLKDKIMLELINNIMAIKKEE
jgi:hypothetical protein